MRLAIYLAAVSVMYALLAVAAPVVANAVVVGFVALLLVPVLVSDLRRWSRARRES